MLHNCDAVGTFRYFSWLG